MATVVDELLVRLNVDPSKWKAGLASAASSSRDFISSLEKNQKALAGLTVTSGLTLASQIAFVKDVTNEYAKQEGAVSKLENLLKQDQRTRADSVAILTKQADALQRITPFADEAIISMQATAAAFGLTDQQIQKLTPSLLDVAAGFRDVDGNALDLDTVMKAVGKAVDGNSASLKKLGIDIKLTGDRTKDFETVMATLKERFDGAAEAAGTTFSGQMKIASNQISEVKEQIGSALAPVILDMANKIVPLVTRFGEWASAHKDIVLAIVGGGIAGSGLLAALSTLFFVLAQLGAAAGPIVLVTIGIAALVGWIIKLKVASDTSLGDMGIDVLNAKIQDTQKYIEELIATRNKLTEGGAGLNNTQFLAIFQFGGVDKAIDEIDKKLAEARAELGSFDVALGNVSTTELESELEATEEKLEGLNSEIVRLKSGGQSDFSVDLFNSLIAQAEAARLKVEELKDALKITEPTSASRSGFLGPRAETPAATEDPEAERNARLAIARTVEFQLKSTKEWLSARLSMIETEYAAELQKAEEAGKDTVAIQIKYDKEIRDAKAAHYAALREMHTRYLDSQIQDKKIGTLPDDITTPGGSLDGLDDQVNARAGIKVTPDVDQVRQDWDDIVEITNDATEEINDSTSATADELSARLQQIWEQAAMAVGQIIGATGELFVEFLQQGNNVGNALGKTIVLSAVEALKTVVKAFGAAEIAKATMGAAMSFGATLLAIGPIAAAMAAALGTLSAIGGSFQKKNGGSYEMGGVLTRTDTFIGHEGEVIINPRRNSAREVAANIQRAGATDLVAQAVGAKGGNGGGDVYGSFRIFGNVNKQVDMDEALRNFAKLLRPVVT